ncbi:sodium:solute symporter [Synoicihabitans lomoniglobus]|uniref:Sodium:solute symporter n=1 Tax=Synoicihabitans lomoniglobus TaxID=2909285 RepID=A0AAF0CRX3_9BACT|nr:sodium:solute symporter [Opitutaceae bacterium LMO-M01]WED66965.1 sodium:solute symporter [Opitutaceae bacterium LMO-M01]
MLSASHRFFLTFWILILSAGVASANELVSLEMRDLTAAEIDELVLPNEELPADHAAPPAPLMGDAISPSGQAFRLGANLSGPQQLTFFSYHAITNTWAKVGSIDLPAVPARLSPIPRGFVVGFEGSDRRAAIEVVQVKSSLPVIDWVVIAGYLIAMLGVGWYCYNREKRGAGSTTDYFLAGRDVPWWAAGLSLYATGTSAISFIAIPALSFSTNWLYLGQQCIGVFGLLFVAYKIIPVLRRLNLISIYHYLEMRFHPSIRLMSSALVILFQLVGRLSVVLYLPALAIASVTGANVVVCIVLMGFVTTLYTLVGGMKAVIWTDVIQVFVMMGGALFAVGYMINGIDGGIGEMINIANAEQKAHLFDFSWNFTTPTVWALFLVILTDVPTWPKEQVMMQRVLATRSDKDARSSVLTLAAVVIPGSFLFYAIGTALFTFYKTHPDRLNPLIDTDATFPVFIAAELPIGITGLIIAGLFAASMSTLSSGLNSVATLSSIDFYERLVPKASSKTSLRLAYAVTILSGVISTAVAVLFTYFDIKSMFDAMLQLTAILGGGFAGTYALGLFTKRANWQGALIGTGASVACAVLLAPLISPILLNPASIATCMIVGYLASWFFPAPTQSLKGLSVFTPRQSPITSLPPHE